MLHCACVKTPCLPSLVSFGVGVDKAAADPDKSDAHEVFAVFFKAVLGKSKSVRAPVVASKPDLDRSTLLGAVDVGAVTDAGEVFAFAAIACGLAFEGIFC